MGFGYCRDCKHWDLNQLSNNGAEAYWKPGQVDACRKVPLLADCVSLNYDDSYHIKEEYINNKAFAQDASDYSAILYTTADFGCVQFEKK